MFFEELRRSLRFIGVGELAGVGNEIRAGLCPVACGEPLDILKSEEWHRFTFYNIALAVVWQLNQKGKI